MSTRKLTLSAIALIFIGGFIGQFIYLFGGMKASTHSEMIAVILTAAVFFMIDRRHVDRQNKRQIYFRFRRSLLCKDSWNGL